MKTQKDGAGYVMTISIPWSNLNHPPHAGDIIGLQIRVNDAHADGPVTHRIWFPIDGLIRSSSSKCNSPTTPARPRPPPHGSRRPA